MAWEQEVSRDEIAQLERSSIMTELMQGSNSKQTPYLRKQGSATQLIVDGKPFLILGGELHNSSSSHMQYMQPIWERLVALHMNTALAPVSWELIEPEEGVFNFSLVDGLIQEARRYKLRLIFLWFGSWKNGMSSYVPLWVKQDYQRFPRVKLQNGQSVEVLSTLAEANWQADARAFAALMRHIRAVDAQDSTVIMMQVENEVGVLHDSRDRSEIAQRAFAEQVPQTLIEQLQQHRHELSTEVQQCWESSAYKTAGSWEEVFGSGTQTDEIFMAWNYACYLDKVAAAGKAEYDIPMFVNAWLDHHPQRQAGDWPSGGPLPRSLDIWLAGAAHIDLLCPDIYFGDFQQWCQLYTRRGNPLFIPETRSAKESQGNLFYAFGQHKAIGTSPFAIDSIENPALSPLSKSYALLEQIVPFILEHQGKGEMLGFQFDEQHPGIIRELGGYELDISLDQVFGFKAEYGYGLIIVSGPNEFIGVGYGFRVIFRAKTPGPALVGLASVDEGVYQNGKWIAGRRLNGDETAQGQWWRFSFSQPEGSIERCLVYRYE